MSYDFIYLPVTKEHWLHLSFGGQSYTALHTQSLSEQSILTYQIGKGQHAIILRKEVGSEHPSTERQEYSSKSLVILRFNLF